MEIGAVIGATNLNQGIRDGGILWTATVPQMSLAVCGAAHLIPANGH
jgi:hypothetical protein